MIRIFLGVLILWPLALLMAYGDVRADEWRKQRQGKCPRGCGLLCDECNGCSVCDQHYGCEDVS